MLSYNQSNMNKSKFINSFLTANIYYKKYSRNYRRLILLNILLYVTVFMLGVFALVNAFKVQDYIVAGMDTLVCLSLIYAIIDIHKHKRLNRAINIFVTILFLFLLSFSLVNQNESNGLVWTVFFPLVTILLMNRNKALSLVTLFYFMLFFFAFEGIGSWQNGNWDLVSFLRFVAASTTLTYVVYFMEYSHELSENQLELVRIKEEEGMRSLKELSIKDALTQLYNRRHLNEVFDREFKTAQRHNYYFGFFILDIDYFKQYNDAYGHQKGDEALCSLADVLKTRMRRSEDFIFRLGGEEFCGICVSEDKSKITAQLKVLLHAIESLHIEHSGSSISKVLTVSIGVKIIHDFDEYGFDRLYKEADEALYKAKHEGRNRIVF
ncbi:MAG: hypothetical protein COA44_09380 [Arcobacter sp.]|nr:MAG: hypothetical protein COA44_09380 [Arcobacter sp.]